MPAGKDILKPYSAVNDIFRISIPEIRLCADMPNEIDVYKRQPKHNGGFEVMGIEEIKAKFDIQSPAQVIDMLGLMGDSSDTVSYTHLGLPEIHHQDSDRARRLRLYERGGTPPV